MASSRAMHFGRCSDTLLGKLRDEDPALVVRVAREYAAQTGLDTSMCQCAWLDELKTLALPAGDFCALRRAEGVYSRVVRARLRALGVAAEVIIYRFVLTQTLDLELHDVAAVARALDGIVQICAAHMREPVWAAFTLCLSLFLRGDTLVLRFGGQVHRAVPEDIAPRGFEYGHYLALFMLERLVLWLPGAVPSFEERLHEARLFLLVLDDAATDETLLDATNAFVVMVLERLAGTGPLAVSSTFVLIGRQCGVMVAAVPA